MFPRSWRRKRRAPRQPSQEIAVKNGVLQPGWALIKWRDLIRILVCYTTLSMALGLAVGFVIARVL